MDECTQHVILSMDQQFSSTKVAICTHLLFILYRSAVKQVCGTSRSPGSFCSYHELGIGRCDSRMDVVIL